MGFEGPISLPRLVSLVGAGFGLQRAEGSRRTDIEEQVGVADVTVDGDRFVRPSDVNPDSWSEFRPSGSDVPGEFYEISPVEIRNAPCFILAEDPSLVGESLDREIMQTFGKSLRTAGLRKHLKVSLGSTRRRCGPRPEEVLGPLSDCAQLLAAEASREASGSARGTTVRLVRSRPKQGLRTSPSGPARRRWWGTGRTLGGPWRPWRSPRPMTEGL